MRDLRYAIRVLLKAPAFTIAAVLTLALCIGANTAIYTRCRSRAAAPPPVPATRAAGRSRDAFLARRHRDGQTGGTWEALQRGVTSVELATTAGGFGSTGVNMVVGTHAEYVKQQRVSAAFFRVLGVPPAIGREFTADEDRTNGPAAAILSHQSVDAVVQRRSGRTRPIDHAARRTAHDRWRDARWLHERRTGGPVDPGAAMPDVRRQRAELRDHRPA